MKEDIEAIKTDLKKWIEQSNYTVYTIVRHVSKSGMQRHISVVIPVKRDDGGLDFVHPSYAISKVLGWKYSEKYGHNAVVVNGCGMDMGFHLVYSLSMKLSGDGYKIKQEWI